MAVPRETFIAAARSWVGTPFHQKGRLKGVGIDCNGLVVAALNEAGLPTPDDMDYRHPADPVKLVRQVAAHGAQVPIAEAAPGDVALFAIHRERPQHFGILTRDSIIHADWEVGRTVEHRLTVFWAKRMTHVFRHAGLEAPACLIVWPNPQSEIESDFSPEEEKARLTQGGCCGPGGPA